MIAEIIGVLVDASEPTSGIEPYAPEVQNLAWPEADDGTIRIRVITSAGIPVNLSGALILSVRRRETDSAPTFSREATVTSMGDGLAEFPVVSADTYNEPRGTYRYDVNYTDLSGKRWQLVPVSEFKLDPIINRPGEPVTVPVAQDPLAQGPPGPAPSLLNFVTTGLAAPGAVTAAGAEVGDELLQILNLTVPGDGRANFETTVSVADQVQQIAGGNLSAVTFSFLILKSGG